MDVEDNFIGKLIYLKYLNNIFLFFNFEIQKRFEIQ